MDFEAYKSSLAEEAPPEGLEHGGAGAVVGGKGRLAPG